MVNINTCRYFEECSAPLCPFLSDQMNEEGIWYPYEEICRRAKGVPKWIKQQRKIANKAKPENHKYYYTLDMLKVPFRVTEAVKGIDPDKPNQERKLQVWHKRYKGSKSRKLSDEAREKRRKIIEHARKFKQNAKDGKEDLAA